MVPSSRDEQSRSVPRVPTRRSTDTTPAPARSFVLAPTWESASIARERLHAWLQIIVWPPGQTDDLVLAVSEAVSNSVEHGYRVALYQIDVEGHIIVTGRLVAGPNPSTRHVVLTVADGGQWREHPGGNDAHRGHGMPIMRSCSSTMSVTADLEGTTIVLTSQPVPTIEQPS